jgi:hypothetical protein
VGGMNLERAQDFGDREGEGGELVVTSDQWPGNA